MPSQRQARSARQAAEAARAPHEPQRNILHRSDARGFDPATAAGSGGPASSAATIPCALHTEHILCAWLAWPLHFLLRPLGRHVRPIFLGISIDHLSRHRRLPGARRSGLRGRQEKALDADERRVRLPTARGPHPIDPPSPRPGDGFAKAPGSAVPAPAASGNRKAGDEPPGRGPLEQSECGPGVGR
jgi:hypothetical protein